MMDTSTTFRKFWLVWSPTGESPPSVQHRSLGDAEREAGRLARTRPGNEFFVLMTISRVAKPDVVWSLASSSEDEGIPF